MWQEISFCDLKFCHVAGNFFLKQEISSCGNISSLWYKIATKLRDFWSYLKIATKVRDFYTKLRLKVQGFLARFLPPCPLKSHPGTDSNNKDKDVVRLTDWQKFELEFGNVSNRSFVYKFKTVSPLCPALFIITRIFWFIILRERLYITSSTFGQFCTPHVIKIIMALEPPPPKMMM